MKKILALVLSGLLGGAVTAGENMTDLRQQMQQTLAGVSSSLFTDRVKSLRQLTTVLDPQLLKEFRAIEKVKAIVDPQKQRDNPENVNVRIEALNTLTVFKTNGIEIPNLLKFFNDIISEAVEDAKGKDPVRKAADIRVANAALAQLPNIAPMQAADAPANPERDQALGTLKRLYEKRDKLPQTTYMALISALGNFGDKDEAVKTLFSIAEKETKNQNIRYASLRSIRNAVSVLNSVPAKTVKTMEGWLEKSTGDNNADVKTMLVECLEIMTAKLPPDSSYTINEKTKAQVLDMLKNGTDPEAISAVKFLMRVSAKDISLVDNFLEAADPRTNKNKNLSFRGLETINAGLVNVLNSISNEKSTAKQQAANAAAQKIIVHMLNTLDPGVKGVPEEIKETMIMGLGIIPMTFDRTQAVTCLVSLLEIEGAKEAPIPGRIRALEDALTSLTGCVPFSMIKFEQLDQSDGTVRFSRKRIPDIAAWKAWLGKDENKKALLPTKK